MGNQSTLSITLKEDNAQLDEVVVVGYGVQKKKLVTGATVEVKGEDIAKMNTTQVLGALQSQSPVKAGWDIGRMVFSGTTPLMGIQPNVGGNQYDYHILKADDKNLRLCAPEPGAGDWGTAWFWNFKRKD